MRLSLQGFSRRYLITSQPGLKVLPQMRPVPCFSCIKSWQLVQGPRQNNETEVRLVHGSEDGTHSWKVRSIPPPPVMKFLTVKVDRQPRHVRAMHSPLKIASRLWFSGTACTRPHALCWSVLRMHCEVHSQIISTAMHNTSSIIMMQTPAQGNKWRSLGRGLPPHASCSHVNISGYIIGRYGTICCLLLLLWQVRKKCFLVWEKIPGAGLPTTLRSQTLRDRMQYPICQREPCPRPCRWVLSPF